MSKKDRLKAQAEKQNWLRKQLVEEELRDREAARGKQSKAAAKLIKQSKGDPLAVKILKIIMLIPFAYSGFFYGGVIIFGIAFNRIEPVPPDYVLWCAVSGVAVIFIGIIIEFFSKHLISFITITAGTVLYMKAALYFIDHIKKRFEEVYVPTEIENMDIQYMQRHYPIAAVGAISLIILIITTVRKIIAAKRAKAARDNAPVKSIVEE